MSEARTAVPVAVIPLLILMLAGCDGGEQITGMLLYPDASRLGDYEEILQRAHFVMNPDAEKSPEMLALETEDPVNRVAEFYADLYGIRKVAENPVGNFSAWAPAAYYREGDLGEDLRSVRGVVTALGLDIDPDRIEGRYHGAHIMGTSLRPRVTIQRPYLDLSSGKVVDRTLILLVQE